MQPAKEKPLLFGQVLPKVSAGVLEMYNQLKIKIMYYKVTNKESEVYKQLFELRQTEQQIEENNEKLLAEKIPYKWEEFSGYIGQQNFGRTTQYCGFVFLEPEKVDLKVWKRDKDNKKLFEPNRKTKAGKEMANFLFNGMERSGCNRPFEILGIERGSRFSFPYVEICNDGDIVICLGNRHIPKDDVNIIEITSKEFNEKLED